MNTCVCAVSFHHAETLSTLSREHFRACKTTFLETAVHVVTYTSASKGLQQDCPNEHQSWKDKTASTGPTPCTRDNITASLQLITRRVSIVIVEFHFAKTTGGRYLANERSDAPCKCCLNSFTKLM